MMKYVVCGSSVEDVQNGVEAMKLAMASGAPCGVGGSSMAEVEKALSEMRGMLPPSAIGERMALTMMGMDCLHPSCDCPCPCCECEDDDDYEDGYLAYHQSGEAISYDLHDTAEEAMADALDDGQLLDEITIEYVRAYDNGKIETLERVYPN